MDDYGRDRKRIHGRIEYLLAHENEQTWDERMGHSGEYGGWTSLLALRRELQLIEYAERLDRIDKKLSVLLAAVRGRTDYDVLL